jgi:signal transduction histidine kinase
MGMDLTQSLRADEGAISPPVKVAIFRILQEACGNAWKHSQAQRLSVVLETDAEGIRLEVVDDGVGFDTTSSRRFRGGFGLASMRERAAMTGGRLSIRSRLGQGTRVIAVWPANEGSERTPQ